MERISGDHIKSNNFAAHHPMIRCSLGNYHACKGKRVPLAAIAHSLSLRLLPQDKIIHINLPTLQVYYRCIGRVILNTFKRTEVATQLNVSQL